MSCNPRNRGANKSGSVLLSHTRGVVPSALEGLTSVFGMGTGGTPPLSPPELVAPLESAARLSGSAVVNEANHDNCKMSDRTMRILEDAQQ